MKPVCRKNTRPGLCNVVGSRLSNVGWGAAGPTCHGWDSRLAAVGLGSLLLGPVRRCCAQPLLGPFRHCWAHFAVIGCDFLVGPDSPLLGSTSCGWVHGWAI
jgi:hypothetical protein